MACNPRIKRPYQPTLDSYLVRSTALSSHPTSSPPSSPVHFTTAAAHHLPNVIQSSLLTVGMRVRKAVPGGYQNSTQAAVTFPGKWTIPLGELSRNTGQRPGMNARTDGPARLEPFCCIHKVGGWGSQENLPLSGADQENGVMDYGFSSSQESNVSTISMNEDVKNPVMAKDKRRWDEHEDEGTEGDCEDNSVFAVVTRPRIRPATRRRTFHNQINSHEIAMTDAKDFEDAPFLLPPLS